MSLTEALSDILCHVPRYPLYDVDFDEQFYWTVPRNSIVRPLPDFTNHCEPVSNPLKRAFDQSLASATGEIIPAVEVLNAASRTLGSDISFVAFEHCLDFVKHIAHTGFFRLINFELLPNQQCGPSGMAFWISGLSNRGCFQDEDWSVKITDKQGSWTYYIHIDDTPTVCNLLQHALPNLEKNQCAMLSVNGSEVHWDHLMPSGTLIIDLLKAHRIFQVSGTAIVLHIYCDPIDTVLSICESHPLLRDMKRNSDFEWHVVCEGQAPNCDFNIQRLAIVC